MKFFVNIFLKPLSFIPALLMMYIIFSFSAQNGTTSAGLSYKVSHKVVSVVDKALDLELTDTQIHNGINKIHFYIRKTAHFLEYFLLAISVTIPLYVYRIRSLWLMLTASILCICFAGFDELHQLYVDGRAGSLKDVFIDSMGIISGIIFVKTFGYIFAKTILEPLFDKRT